jgi:hypothetical protein
MQPVSTTGRDVALALLETIANRFLSGDEHVTVRTLMRAIGQARQSGASGQEIRRALWRADFETRGGQRPQAVALVQELMSQVSR